MQVSQKQNFVPNVEQRATMYDVYQAWTTTLNVPEMRPLGTF